MVTFEKLNDQKFKELSEIDQRQIQAGHFSLRFNHWHEVVEYESEDGSTLQQRCSWWGARKTVDTRLVKDAE